MIKYIFLLAVFFQTTELAKAEFSIPEIENVPIDRMLQNLEKKFADSKKSGESASKSLVPQLHQLARLNAMAYSLSLSEAKEYKNPYDKVAVVAFNEIYEPSDMGFDIGRQLPDPEHGERAEFLDKSIQYYREFKKLSPEDWRAALGLGWVLSLKGQKDEARAVLRDGLKLVNGDPVTHWISKIFAKLFYFLKGEKKRALLRERLNYKDFSEGSGLGLVASAEFANYLIPLLDFRLDSDEIGKIKKRVSEDVIIHEVNSWSRPITPVAIPLVSGSSDTLLINESAAVKFDLDGAGRIKKWSWLTPNLAWLVYSKSRPNKQLTGLDLFGSVTFWIFWEDGFGALCSLDNDGDGGLSGGELENLWLWNDKNSNGRNEAEEILSLSSLKITRLACDRSSVITEGLKIENGVEFETGELRPIYDLMLERK